MVNEMMQELTNFIEDVLSRKYEEKFVKREDEGDILRISYIFMEDDIIYVDVTDMETEEGYILEFSEIANEDYEIFDTLEEAKGDL